MSSSTTLNLSNYSTVWKDDFGSDSSINTSLWQEIWGNSNDFRFGSGGLTLTSYASEGWKNVGIQTNDFHGPGSSYGYGLFQATFSLNSGEGAGPCILLWPATNGWPGPEIDLMEDWSDPSRQTGYATIHWAGSGNSDHYQTYSFHADMTKKTTVAMDWERGSLTFYVNGSKVFQTTSNVPKDYADGGQNEAFGAEVTAAGTKAVSSSVSLHLYSMSYSTRNSGSGSSGSSTSTPTPTPTPTPSPTPTPTPTGTAGTITLSNPGTVQESSPGAGVDVVEHVSAPGLSKIYEFTMTSKNVAEENWQTVTLDSSGNGTFTAHFEHSGDYLLAVDDPSKQTIKAWTSPITITDTPTGSVAPTPTPTPTPTPSPTATPNKWITVSNPGTVQEASAGAGVDVTATVSDPGLNTIYALVMTKANVAETNWIKVPLDASGSGTFTAHFQHSGDYIVAVNDPSTPVEKGWSSPITITDTPVKSMAALDSVATAPSGPSVTATDTAGKSAAVPIIASGTQTFAATDTGLAGSVGESVADGVTTFTAGSGISGIALSDADGGSYALQNFAAVSADLSGASGGTLAINGASSADVTLGDGNYGVTVANTVGAAAASFTAGAGSDQIRFDGSGPADFTFGTGTATVWGGSGADSFNFHDGDGLGTIARVVAENKPIYREL
ncbi:MAG: family 16 glycosylhydrolase, partial [Alphaproteobacteria bacterium]|nr:family 16 glycosylhydrolase [Alphaproteobacteria bacterium]